MRVMIAGGGIGGLAAGLAVARAGAQAVVYERAAALRAVGAGITMQSNAMCVFDQLGIADAVREAGAVIEVASIVDWRGQVLQRGELGPVAAALGQPSVAIHRAALMGVLADAARAAGVEVREGAGVARFEALGDAVEVELEGGERARGDVLVGADGLHSVVRRGLHGEQPVRYSGYTSWRGVCAAVNPARGVETWEAWGRGQRFGIVPIGGGLIYWFAVQDAPPGERDGEDARGELLGRFEGWFEEARGLIAATPREQILRTDCSDREPLAGDWGAGRVTLLGDAAHPMTPNMGQGGGQAVEDAGALAQALAAGGDVASALRAYERGRSARARMFVERSWSLGRVAQWSAAPACWARDRLVGLVPASVMTRQLVETLGGVADRGSARPR